MNKEMKSAASIRNVVEEPWQQFPGHFGGALSKALVRPENVRVANGAAPDGGADNAGFSWSGQVKQLAFRGSRVSLAVETPGQTLNVEAPALMGVREGDALSLSVPRHGAWAIRPDAERP